MKKERVKCIIPFIFSFSSSFMKYMIGNYNKIPYNVLNG